MSNRQMEASEFVKLARLVAENHPKTRKGPGFVGSYHKKNRLLFQDQKIEIAISATDGSMVVSYHENPIPVTIVHPNGKIAFHSVNHAMLSEHLQKLLGEVFNNL